MNDLLNGLGLATGLALYAMLLAMVVRERTRGGHFDSVALATAILGIIWNLSSLSTYALPRFGVVGASRSLSACGIVALGLLPAVVVHSVVRGRHGSAWPRANVALLIAAYVTSTAAACIQFYALASGATVPSVLGLRLVTWGFVVLAIPLVAITSRQPGGRRALWVAALAAFAVSALHLSQFHEAAPGMATELAGHHASVPLAFAILYQDYPFALADLFLKRALLLILLVGTALFGLTLGAMSDTGSALSLALLASGWVATALAYPGMRLAVNWFVDTVVLARPHYRSLETAVIRQLQLDEHIEPLLEHVKRDIAGALSASGADWQEVPHHLADGQPIVETLEGPGVRIVVPTSEAPSFAMEFTRLSGGRRVLSGDVSFLASVGVAVARRIDALRLTQERYERAVREQEVAKLASEAELRALRAQLNPHFLFNALTTIGYLIQTAPGRAVDTLMRLTSLLRGVLRSEGEFTTLGRELDLVEAYLDIERARFEDRLRVRIEVADDLRDLSVPPLILQPLVENAVKHGIAPLRHGGEIVITGIQQLDPPRLVLRVADTGPGMTDTQLTERRAAGVGLTNVARRLECYYGASSVLDLRSFPGGGTLVEISVPTLIPQAVTVRRSS